MISETERHIQPAESSDHPDLGLIAGPAADMIAALRERVETLEARDQVYRAITTGFAAMLGPGQYAVPFSAYDAIAGASVSINPIDEASVVVFAVVWPEAVESVAVDDE